MDEFVIAQDVAKLLPKLQVIIVAAYNINNSETNAQVTKFADDTASATLSALSAYPNAQSHPRIALYRDTLKEKCHLSSKKYPQSNESLYKRLLKSQKALGPINPIVDFYNSISIKHGVTVGAFDLGELQTISLSPLELRMSSNKDTFKALDTGAGVEAISVSDGELVYAQGTTVLTRHLAWRQAAQALVTGKTKNVIFMSEVFCEQDDVSEPTELTRSVAKDLVDGLRQFFSVEAEASFLGDGVGKLSVEVNSAFF